MAANELETHHIGDKEYLTLYDTARWLKVPLDTLYGQIAFGKLDLVQVDSQEFIELEALKAYAEKRKPKVSGWDRVDEFRANK